MGLQLCSGSFKCKNTPSDPLAVPEQAKLAVKRLNIFEQGGYDVFLQSPSHIGGAIKIAAALRENNQT